MVAYSPYLRIEKKIAKKIKALRIAHGYTSYENFALEFDIDRKHYWGIENGKNITIKTLHRILEIHKITFEDFFKGIR